MVPFSIGAGAVNSPGGLYALVGAHPYLSATLVAVGMVLFRKHRLGYFYRKTKDSVEGSVYVEPPMHEVEKIDGFVVAELSPDTLLLLRLVADDVVEHEGEEQESPQQPLAKPKADERKLDGTDRV